MSVKNDVVMITLDRPRQLRFGYKAIKVLMSMTGKDIDAALDMNELDPEDLEKVFYCGLLHDAKEHGETLKLEDVEDLLDKADKFIDLIDKMQEAFNQSFGTTDELSNLETKKFVAAQKK